MSCARTNVRDVARGRWHSILLSLGVDERALSGKHGPCPLCGGKDRFRFDDKEGRGTYYCSCCGAGDGLRLAVGFTGKPFRDVALEVERLAGVVKPAVAKPSRSDADKLSALRRLWVESKPIQMGDESHLYLAGRGLELAELPESIRTHPSLAYHNGQQVTGRYPAMLATVTAPSGRAVSIHRTYLHEGRKAPVAAAKKLAQGLPIVGAAIRLTPISRVLGIAEGVETALAASQQFEIPCWSCISAGGIETFEPPAGVEHIVVFADNDENYAGQAAAYRAAHRLSLRGLEVEVVVPPATGDWLDILNANPSRPLKTASERFSGGRVCG